MGNFQLDSKILVKSKKYRFAASLLTVVAIGLTVIALFQILMNDFKLISIGEILLALILRKYFKIISVFYEQAQLKLNILGDKIEFIFNPKTSSKREDNIKYVVLKENIKNIDYDKKSHLFIFTGRIEKLTGPKTIAEKELVFFCKDEANKIIDVINEKLNVKVF